MRKQMGMAVLKKLGTAVLQGSLFAKRGRGWFGVRGVKCRRERMEMNEG